MWLVKFLGWICHKILRRHYTGNLVKLGFADNTRNITNVGDVLLDNIALHRDVLESLLPLNSTNIVYFRQLLKLRIFDNKGRRYYSPFCMALYMLLTKEHISQDKFCEIVQGLSPYHDITDYDEFIDEYRAGDVIQNDTVTLPNEIDVNTMIKREVFEKHFKNQKKQIGNCDLFWVLSSFVYICK